MNPAPTATPRLASLQDEALGACPLCGSTQRRLRHAALVDDSFRAAAGQWPLWRCGGCGNAYLDPRPNRASIGLAYGRYYTHASAAGPGPASGPSVRLSWRGRLRQWLQAGHLHRRCGLPREGTALGAWLGALLLWPLRPYRHMADVAWRHLPGPGRGRTLLDLGCGDGGFVAQALRCGWQAQGLEPDAQAVAAARQRGLPVRQGGIERLSGQAACFDRITLSHVIEHLHDPLDVLRACRRLLKPGGQLWLATPNLDSLGHRAFGRHWRGLEAPRHLVLFHERGLAVLLRQAGFASVRRLSSAWPEPFILARASRAMALGLPPHDAPPPLPRALWWRTLVRALRATLQPRAREFLYLEARC